MDFGVVLGYALTVLCRKTGFPTFRRVAYCNGGITQMSKPSKSQWDFGELFPAETARKVLSVWELTSDIKRLLEKQIGQVWVSGEITNLRAQSSGHMYFTLKDVAAQLSCVLFRGTATAGRQLLADGQKVLLQGDVTVYEARGQYQMIVRAVELQGVGA